MEYNYFKIFQFAIIVHNANTYVMYNTYFPPYTDSCVDVC